MDFSKKLTFCKALLIPFRFASFHTVLQILHEVITTALNPLSVFVTAAFINAALAVFNGSSPINHIYLPLFGLAGIQAYKYIFGSLNELVIKSRLIRFRRIIRVPFMEKRVKLEFRHVENQNVWDLVMRTWQTPEKNFLKFLTIS